MTKGIKNETDSFEFEINKQFEIKKQEKRSKNSVFEVFYLKVIKEHLAISNTEVVHIHIRKKQLKFSVF